MRREGLGRQKTVKKTKYKPKPYEQMRYAGQRVQVDVKVVPRDCIKDRSWKRYYQYTAIDEYSRLRYLEAFQTADTFSSAVLMEHATAWLAKKGVRIECVRQTMGLNLPNVSRSPNRRATLVCLRLFWIKKESNIS